MYLYQTDSLFGKWKLHKKPIALIGTEARAGGRFLDKRIDFTCTKLHQRFGYGLSLCRFSFDEGTYNVKEKDILSDGNENIKDLMLECII
jgi:hypothetical protein